jgi:hypothetical protein
VAKINEGSDASSACMHATPQVLAEGLDMFRLGTVETGGNMNPSGNLSFTKRIWLDGCLGLEHRGMRSHWLKASATLGQSFWLRALTCSD